MIVPFNPAMYFSDADKDIGEVSKMEPGKVRDHMNSSLEATVSSHVGLYYTTIGLSKQKEGNEDLDLIFGSLNYAPVERTVTQKAEPEKKPVWKGLPQKEPKEKAGQENKEIYMDIAFADTRLLEHLSAKYDVDYVVFFNQFEIITDYENCIDLQMRKYYREIRLHYTVMSKDGKRLGGDVIVLPYHSNENNLPVIIRDNFGEISQILLRNIYLKK